MGYNIDRIIIVASDEACAANKAYGNKSAIEIYQEEIVAYLNRAASIATIFDFDEKCPDIIESPYTGGGADAENPQFTVIQKHNDDYIWDVVRILREEIGDSDVRLFLDMQGGDRNALFSTNAILELLELTVVGNGHHIEVQDRVAIS